MPGTDDLTPFVRDALARGVPRPEIEAALLEAGWPREQVARGLAAYAEIDFPVPVPRPRAYLSPREAFLYLVLFTTLFLAVFNLGGALFDLIERAVPDPAETRYHGDTSLRWHLAYLIVSFPVFLFLTWRQGRELQRDPTKRASRVRKWLTYLTLFVAAGFIVGDLVALVFHFLEGELTLRFLSKVLVVALLAGTTFGYYLWDLRRDEEEA